MLEPIHSPVGRTIAKGIGPVFQVSYFVLVFVIGGLTGAVIGASRKDTKTRAARLTVLGISSIVVLGFFLSFGFFWGVITILELAVGSMIGLALTSGREE